MILSCIIIVLGLLGGLLMLWHVPAAETPSGPVTDEDLQLATRVSLIIPAYNEAKRIRPLLLSLRDQDVQPGEIRLVDDGSTDETAAIAYAEGLVVLSTEQLNLDWVGKSRACWHGAQTAGGDWLLFLDADTRLDHPDSLRRILRTFAKLGGRGGLSLQPHHSIIRLYESLSMVFNIVVMAGMGVFTPWGGRLHGIGFFGPCLICDRCDYFTVGGHAAIHNQIMDDLALGRLFQQFKLPVFSCSGRGTVSFRMYPEGFLSLFEGWTKNFASGATATRPLVLSLIILWICSGYSTMTLLIKAILSDQVIWLIIAVLFYLLYAVLMGRLGKRCGQFPLFLPLFYPILLTFFTFVFIWSLIQTRLLHTVRWRGRKIRL